MGFTTGSTGTLVLASGQLFASNAVLLGNSVVPTPPGPVGQMTISNGTAVLGSLSVGFGQSALGTFTLAGGSVNVTGSVNVADNFSSTGVVWMTGGQLFVTNKLSIVALGDFNSTLGRMTVSNGTVLAQAIGLGFGATTPAHGTLTMAGGVVSVYSNVTIGVAGCSSTSAVIVAGGSLYVTNATHTAVLEVRGGTLELDFGTLVVDNLIMTNACAHFVRNGGTLTYMTAVLDPNRDDDGDGIPNGYEQAHNLDPLNTADASVDNDGDGFSNLQEYLAGTDPNSNTSTFQITSMVITGSDLRVGWTMGPGKTNALQSTAGDGNSGYSTGSFATIFIVTNTVGTTTNFLDAGAATNFPARYYRLRLVP
jgi:hypothetical protein